MTSPLLVQLTKNIVTELRKLQTHAPELLFRLGPKRVTARGPEVRDWCSDARIVLLGIGVHVSRVRKLALGRAVDAVDLGASQSLQGWEFKHLAERVDSSMLEQLITRLVDFRDTRILLEIARTDNPLGEVLASVEKLQEAAHGI